jgi:hypothetical protein
MHACVQSIQIGVGEGDFATHPSSATGGSLVRNQTSIPFLTGDQPVINLDTDGETEPESLSFYFSLSPRLALYLAEPGKALEIPAVIETAGTISDRTSVSRAGATARFTPRQPRKLSRRAWPGPAEIEPREEDRARARWTTLVTRLDIARRPLQLPPPMASCKSPT